MGLYVKAFDVSNGKEFFLMSGGTILARTLIVNHDYGDVRDWEILSIFVPQQYRGRGYGRYLVNHVIKEAEIERVDRIIAYSVSGAIDFYCKLGFKQMRPFESRLMTKALH